MKAEEHPLSQETAFDFKKHASYMKAKALLDGENRLEQLSKFILNTEESLLEIKKQKLQISQKVDVIIGLDSKIHELEETVSRLVNGLHVIKINLESAPISGKEVALSKIKTLLKS